MNNENYNVAEEANIVLDCIYDRILDGDIFNAMHDGVGELNEFYSSVPPTIWKELTQTVFLRHRLTDILHQDPFTLRCFQKPRGYAGDAVMLDYIYGNRAIADDTTEIGRKIFDYTSQSSAPQTVYARRNILAAMIDEVAKEIKQPHIFSLACGHLREAQIAKAVKEGRIGRFVALDSDAESLRLVNQEQSCHGIEIVSGSVRTLLTGKTKLNHFDLIYAAGLYDYLANPVAKKLTSLLFNMLNPGGRVLVANFAPTTRDIGYMESFMGWDLIYRTEEEMQHLIEEIPEDWIKERRIFWEENHNAVFLEITRV